MSVSARLSSVPEFGLIDMNGRFYDPQLGRFLSPDPYVQDMTNPQNFNRYSYCLNNPLKYTDPSGMQLVIDNGAMPYNEFNDGIRKHAPTVPIHTRRGSNGGYGYGSYGYSSYGYNASAASYGINGTYNFLNSLEGSRSGYVFYDPSKIYDYISSGMSFKDWMNEQIKKANVFYMEDLICLLPEVTAIAHDRASQKRAAQEIWDKGHSTAFYSEDGSDIPTARDGNHGIATSRDGGGGCPAAISFGAASANNISNLVGTATSLCSYDARNLSKAQKLKLGYTAIEKIGKGVGVVGLALSAGMMAYDVLSGMADTHTFLDGVAIVAGGAALILGILEAAPMLVTGLAIGVTAYGFASALGFGDVVDDFTNHIGRKIIYGYEDDY
ncbi:MAG: RHS repeat-associated core domain-containing protein [Marinilabiliaceae bacterium]|nr:RHS repeat-associated core domain-containing protein [Marinilabiliaceae bacterium]